MTTATATTTVTNQVLTMQDRIHGEEVTLTGVTGSVDVQARVLRIRNCSLDHLKAMAARLVIENSNVDTVQLQNPDWFWGRDDQVELELALSHVYVVRAEHVRTLKLDRAWISELKAETMSHLDASHSSIEQMWVSWNTPTANVEGCAIGRTNLMVIDAGVFNGHRMNLSADPDDGTVTVTYRGRRMSLRMAKDVFDGDAQLMALLKTGLAQLNKKKEVYS